MMGFGGSLALELGGGPGAVEQVYSAMRSAVGEGNRGDDDSIVEAWRRSRALGLACGFSDERAAAQATPVTATDMLPVYADLQRVVFPPGVTEQDMREALQARHTRLVDATGPSILARARAIRSSAERLTISRAEGTDTQHGRAHEDHVPSHPQSSGPAFGLTNGAAGSKATIVPSYSTDHVVVMQVPTAGAGTQDDVRAVQAVEAMLDEELPAWVDYRVFAFCGFTLDSDLLDLSAFC